MAMVDLEPASGELTRLLGALDDDQLSLPTPCATTTVGDLLDHVDGLALAFAAAARKAPLDGAPSADATKLGDDWRTRIPQRLADLSAAWRRTLGVDRRHRSGRPAAPR